MILLEKCLCRHLGRYWSPAHHSLEQSWCRFHKKMIHYGSKDLRSHCPDLFPKQPCCQSTFPILEDMPATSAPPGGSCSRFVLYFCKLLPCGRTPGTTGTAAACCDAGSWHLCRGFVMAAMVAGFRRSSGVWDDFGLWSACADVSPWRNCSLRFSTSLFVAAFVRWTPSGSIYPSFTDPSCKWNVGPLSMNSTFRSSHNTLRPAFRALMRSMTVPGLMRGQTLDTATEMDVSWALLIRASKSVRISGMDLSSVCLSQSFPPITRIRRQSLWEVGRVVTLALRSLTHPPGMHTHFVFTSLSSSMSLMMLLPSNTVPWGLGKPDQWSALVCWNRAPICACRSLFSFSNLLQVSSLSSSSLDSLWWSSRRQATDDVSVCTRVIRFASGRCERASVGTGNRTIHPGRTPPSLRCSQRGSMKSTGNNAPSPCQHAACRTCILLGIDRMRCFPWCLVAA